VDPVLFDILAEFLASCDVVKSRADLVKSLERATAHLGIDHFVVASLPLPHEKLDGYFIWQRWPKGWFDRYLKLDYFHADPVANLVRQTGRPVIWSKALQLRNLPAKARRIMAEAAEFGLVDGLTIPMHSTAGAKGIFSFAGTRHVLSSQESRVLQIIAESADRRLNEIDTVEQTPDPVPHITKAESECLTWCVAGKTDREIAKLTGRSPLTVRDHIINLERKLSVVNRPQLIAEAFRRGLQR
jgi:LuxR family transcriptional regulator, quorum-sensing system regulator BjaR1